MKSSRHLFATLLAASSPAFAASFSGVEVPAPPPPKIVSDTYFGVRVDDPYRFFEDVKDSGVQAWMKAQADATAGILARVPGRDPLLARIKQIDSISSGSTSTAVRVASGRYFFQKRDPADNQFRLVYRDTANGPDRLIVVFLEHHSCIDALVQEPEEMTPRQRSYEKLLGVVACRVTAKGGIRRRSN